MNNTRLPLDLVARIDRLTELRLATIHVLRDSLHPHLATRLGDLPALTERRGWLVWAGTVRALLDTVRGDGGARGSACCAFALQTLDTALVLLASDLLVDAWDRVA